MQVQIKITGRDFVMSEKFNILDEIFYIVTDRKANPRDGSYTNYLFDKGIDKICKKIGEEASEVIIAAKNNSRRKSDMRQPIFCITLQFCW